MNDKAKQTSDLDQAIAGIGDLLPRAAKSFYVGCLSEGFSKKQADTLTKELIGQMTAAIFKGMKR